MITKYYYVQLHIYIYSKEEIIMQMELLQHKECFIFITDPKTPEKLIENYLDINEKFDSDISIIFMAKSGNSAIDSEFEGKLQKKVVYS